MNRAHTTASTTPVGKRAVNVTLPADLVERAKSAGINLSATLQVALERELRERARAAWLSENGRAIRGYNEDVEQRGAFGDSVRTF